MTQNSRLIGRLPKVGIRPVIDGREMGVRESLEVQTMNMAKAAAKFIEENLRFPSGEKVECVISDTTIGGVADAAYCADKFEKEGVGVSLTVSAMLVLRNRSNGYPPFDAQSGMGVQRHRTSGRCLFSSRIGRIFAKRTSGFRNLWPRCSGCRRHQHSCRCSGKIVTLHQSGSGYCSK